MLIKPRLRVFDRALRARSLAMLGSRAARGRSTKPETDLTDTIVGR